MITRENLEEVNKSLGTVDISKGNKKTRYVMVNERVKAFRMLCPSGSITTEIISCVDGVVTMRAIVKDDNGNVLASGLAQEKETSSFINKTSYIENCETSAVGRALGFAGIGIDGSMASAEEVANAIMNQGEKDSAIENEREEAGAYPSRNAMLEVIERKYPEGTKFEENLLRTMNVKSLKELSENQIIAVYNKCMEKKG